MIGLFFRLQTTIVKWIQIITEVKNLVESTTILGLKTTSMLY